VNNAVKHSGARSIAIRLSASELGITLEVKDDGKGFAAERGNRTSMGLCTMAYRSRSLGSNLQIDSSTDGTTIRCDIPLTNCKTEVPALHLS
jgi:signal transduction histidine kinase